jgi:hypothetical protein
MASNAIGKEPGFDLLGAYNYLKEAGKEPAKLFDRALDTLNLGGQLIDLGAKVVGLGQPLADVAKVVVGVAIANPLMALNGVSGLIAGGLENAPAITELPGGGGFQVDFRKHPQIKCEVNGYGRLTRKPQQGLMGDSARSPALGFLGGRPPELRGGGYLGGSQLLHGQSAHGCIGPAHYNPGSPLDPHYGAYRDCLQILDANWNTFDAAVGRLDQFLTKENLCAIASNPNASDKLRWAAQFLLDHPEYFNRLEMAAGVGGKDGIVGHGDVKAELAKVDRDIARHGLPGGGASRGVGGSAGVLADPSLSLEEKIMLILQRVLEQTDQDLMAATAELEGQSKAQGSGKPGTDSAREMAQLKLQRLMEKRKAMFDLMSNVSSKFHEMSKTAIQNLGRA